MKTPARLGLGLLLSGLLTAPLPGQSDSEPPPAAALEIPERSEDELDELLGPIALYPDDLIALILPAAVQGTDIVLAARYFDSGGKVANLDAQPWDESVRALAHFPDLIEWLNKNLSWTQDLGDAFALQPDQVMKSIQRLRARAYAAGNLRDTPQQRVLVDGDVIRIVSAEENVVYVPQYRTEVVYVDRPVHYVEPVITFGIGWHIGSWYRWDCDWYGNRIWVFHTHDHWRAHRFHHHHRHNHHWDHDHGRAWRPHHQHRPRHHVRDHDRDHRRNRSVDAYRRSRTRPTLFVENQDRGRERNDRDNRRDQNRNGDDRRLRTKDGVQSPPAASTPPRNVSAFNRSRNQRGNDATHTSAPDRSRDREQRAGARSRATAQIPAATQPAQTKAAAPAPASSARISPPPRVENSTRAFSRSRSVQNAPNAERVRNQPRVAPQTVRTATPPAQRPSVSARPSGGSRDVRVAPPSAARMARPEPARGGSRSTHASVPSKPQSSSKASANVRSSDSRGGRGHADKGSNAYTRSRTR